MITIASYLHRDRLKDLIKRWMYNDPRPDDAEDIVRLVYFNNAFISRYLPVFSELVFSKLHDLPLKTQKARLKGDLKNVIVTNVPYRSSRIEEMLENCHSTPGLYYRETPFHGVLYLKDNPEGIRYVGSNRIKRVRRLSEKSARRIIDWIYETIKSRVDDLAVARARRMGIEISSLITPQEYMIEEFLKAEKRLLDDLKNRRSMRNAEEMVIHDVAGVKVIVEDSEQKRFVDDLWIHRCAKSLKWNLTRAITTPSI